LLNEPVICTNPVESLALIIVTSIPYFVQHFHEPLGLASNLAQAIGLHCQMKLSQLDNASTDHPLSNLITVLQIDNSIPNKGSSMRFGLKRNFLS
jgi:hypothetical protein